MNILFLVLISLRPEDSDIDTNQGIWNSGIWGFGVWSSSRVAIEASIGAVGCGGTFGGVRKDSHGREQGVCSSLLPRTTTVSPVSLQ
jgi:hypothetical protein